jgi:hypothetical protein
LHFDAEATRTRVGQLVFSGAPQVNKVSAIESSRLTATYLSVSDLTPDPRNARTHPKRQIDQIRASIEAFGFTNPIPADPDGRIIASRSRLQAARLMGLSPRPAAQRNRGRHCRLTNFHAGQ